MNKRILLLLLPAFLLSGCNQSGSNEYKKCNYFSDENRTYLTIDGYVKEVYDIATYEFSDEDYNALKASLAEGVTMPKEIAVIYRNDQYSPINGTYPSRRAPLTVGLSISGYFANYFYLNLKEGSEATYERYTEVSFNEASKTAKYIVHENVKNTDSKKSYEKAYEMYNGSNVYTKGEDGKITEYIIVNALLNLDERTLERYHTFTNSESYAYSFAE